MTYLLDVNVLVALFDASHVHHDRAHDFFEKTARRSFATCPITENGCVRVLSNPAYGAMQTTPTEILRRLGNWLKKQRHHSFWSDDISLTNTEVFDSSHIVKHGEITDVFLLGLAVAHRGKLATFDGRINTRAVLRGNVALQLIP